MKLSIIEIFPTTVLATSASGIPPTQRLPLKTAIIHPETSLSAILAALAQTNPDDASTAQSALTRRATAEDISAILAALAENNPEDAAAARAVL